MKESRATRVIENVVVVLLCLTVSTCDSASWLQQKRLGFIFYVGEQVDINCTLDDPNINVTLWFAKMNDKGVLAPYREIVPDARIQQYNQIFRLSKMKRDDEGQYECRAENITSLAVLEVHVSNAGVPEPKPKISINPSLPKYGKKVEFKCSAKGSAKLNWYKSKRNGTRKDWQRMKSFKEKNSLKNGKLIVGQSLTIEKFNVSDNGVYICELNRKSVKWWTYTEKYVSIGDFQMPRFTSFPEPLQTAKEGKGVYWEIEYRVTGVPTPSIAWYKIHDDNDNMTEVLYKCIEDVCSTKDEKNYYIDSSYFMKFHLSFPDDNSTYKCVATNSLGTVTKTFRLNVLAKPKIAETKSIVSVYKDSSGTELVCRVEKANPSQITFTWQAQLTACTNSEDCNPNNSNWRTITGKEVGLQIVAKNGKSTVTIKESEQHFFYRCVAKTDIGEDQFVWTVISATGPRPLKAVQNLVEIDEKEDVKLACEVAKFTSTLVQWKYNNVVLDLSPRMRVENSTRNGTVYNTLHIKKVNVTDAGKYECFGEFSGSILAAKIQLKVRELQAPVVSLNELTAKQDSFFFIRCNVIGYPKPRITWKKDGEVVKRPEVLDSSSASHACKNRKKGIYMVTNEDKDHATKLLICNADYRLHSGQFSCTARSRLGNDSASAFINITAPPEIIKLAEPEMELGEKFFLKCEANGNPKPHVWWEKKDENSLTYKLVKNERSDELNFDPLDKSNIGSYRCFAQNGFETVSKNFTLVPQPSARAIHGPPNNSKKYAVVIGCVSFFILAIVIIVAVILYKRKKIYGGFYILTLPPLTDYIKKLDPHKPLTEQTNKLPYDAEWEFPRNRLKFSRELGSGAFGKVYLADAMGIVAFDPRGSTKRRSTRRRFGGSGRRSNHYVNNNKMTKVAVKTLKEDSGEAEYKDLLSELKILIHVGEHKNIVNLLGACTKGRESELWVIIEFCSNGNLLQFLRNRRDIYETEWKGISKDPNFQLTMTDLVIAAYQIARGMEFLASRMCIHRDLATRNILMTDNYVIKIADFGLARDVGEESQYVKTSTGLLPVKWMAIEAIIQRLFTEKSDVWSFGIVLWELFTLGGTPYPNISPNEVAEFLARGLRMEPPHACPDEISSLMMNCWEEEKDCRPTFKELVEILDKIIELHTSSEGGRGYLEVQGEVMNEYLSPSEVKSPQMDPFECNSPLPPIPSPGENERDSLLLKDQNARGRKFDFDKAVRNKAARQDSEIEKIKNDHRPEIAKGPDVKCIPANDPDGYIDTSLTGKEKERIEQELEKDRDSSEEPQHLRDYAYWKKSLV